MAMGSTTWAMQCPPAFTAPEGGLGNSRGAEKSDCPCPWHNARHHTYPHLPTSMRSDLHYLALEDKVGDTYSWAGG